MPIEVWFPLMICFEDLADAAAHKDEMHQACLDLRDGVLKQGGTSDGPGAWTGDVHAIGQIHDDQRFKWVVGQVEKHTFNYLQQLGVDVANVDVHFQRSWPVLSGKGQRVAEHAHVNAHISAVYYVTTGDSNESGNIVFHDQARQNEISPEFGSRQTQGFLEQNAFNIDTVAYPPVEGRLLIFPAKLRHSVNENLTDQLRVSLSFDIAITAKSEVDKDPSEFLMPAPNQWKRFETSPPQQGESN